MQLKLALNNNTTVSVSDGSVGLAPADPPEISTAEQLILEGQSDDPGETYNVLPNTITTLTIVPDGIQSVFNPAAFSGGSDQEAVEDYRTRLLAVVRSPSVGSLGDIKAGPRVCQALIQRPSIRTTTWVLQPTAM